MADADPKPTDAAPPSRGAPIAALAMLATALAVAVRRSADPDLPWHVATGARAVAERSTLPVDPFSYSYAGAPWPYKDLAADVLLYLAHAALGRYALAALHVAAALAFPLLLAIALPKKERDPYVLVAVVSIVVGGCGLPQRPQLFAHLLFVALLALFDRAHRELAAKDDRRALARALAPIVLVEWAWVWMHRSAPLGLLLGVAFAVRLAAARAARDRGALAILAGPAVSARAVVAAFAASVGAIALALLNPAGVAFFRTSLAVAGSSMLRRYVTEWIPLGLGGFFRDFPLGASLTAIALVAGAAWLVRAARTGRASTLTAWHVLLPALFVGLLWDAARWAQYAVLSAGVLLVHVATELRAAGRARRLAPRGAGVLALLVAFSLVVVNRRKEPYALGDDPRQRPVGAVAWAQAHGLRGEVVAPFYFGGYLLEHAWPETRVLVDGRNDMVYPPEFVIRTIAAEEEAGVFAEMRREDGASWALAPNAPGRLSYRFLATDPRWMMVYWSDYAVVYARRSAHPELAGDAYEILRDPDALVQEVPGALASGASPGALHAELLRMLRESPESLRANTALCFFYHLGGPAFWPKRDALLERLRAISPDDTAVRALQDQLAASPAPR